MLTLLRVLFVCALAFVAAIVAQRRMRRRRARQLEAQWAAPKPCERLDAEEMADVAHYFETRAAAAPADAAAPVFVDAITWNDLEMDSIFALLNYAQTTPGEEVLYAMLRDTGTPAEVLARRRLIMRVAREDGAARQRLRLALAY